jgi:ATP synthase protein I
MAGAERPQRDPTLSKTADAYRKAQPYFDAVWQLMGGALVGTAVGYFLDRKLGTTPWLLVALSLAGITAGFIGFITSINRLSRKK